MRVVFNNKNKIKDGGIHESFDTNFSILKSGNFTFLTCYMDASGYIKKVWVVDNAINSH